MFIYTILVNLLHSYNIYTTPYFGPNRSNSYSLQFIYYNNGKNERKTYWLHTKKDTGLGVYLFLSWKKIKTPTYPKKKMLWLYKNNYAPLWPPSLPLTIFNIPEFMDKATNRLCDSAVYCLLIFTFIFMVIMRNTIRCLKKKLLSNLLLY